MTATWNKSQHTSLLLWDIDREFQNAYELYVQLQAKSGFKRSAWSRLAMKSQDDVLAKALSLGREVRNFMGTGKKRFGARFEEGDATCHTILEAQLIRMQYEVRELLCDSAVSEIISIPYEDIITTAKSIRRICLEALHAQFERFSTPTSMLYLPPPRFKIQYCAFAEQLRKDLESSEGSNLQTKKLRPRDRHDDREICPDCDKCIAVATHSGLPDARCILFTSHIKPEAGSRADYASYACSSCYKTFDDSYAFLDHIFQKQIGSDRSCLRVSSPTLDIHEFDPFLIEQCFKNCLVRELSRTASERVSKDQATVQTKEIEVRLNSLRSATSW
ncbi:uncharacterized protein M421DRAFT_70002 [Didymella exigua CBS 183.55]|uniref:C2H2-type domain-containing protein n=1 Tax=Didymella exigua CBS 183.55 TaxID=1150837 RepID=A0A6A5REB0_9PLEO|nr:uncharacterized protein M421DRAFT_70002 [Didymella exigua CBS 183.55]KAF1925444.1 hypothetical protein M421DRAFT_70002 [Didymella exigua CBS 183.55]